MPYFRSDQAAIHVNVAGVALDKEPWDMLEGGDPVAEEVNIFPGGMAPQVALGGLPKWGPLTVERAWSEALGNVFKELIGGVGNAPAEVSYVQFNTSKQPVPGAGHTYTYTGVLLSVQRPKYKATESVEAFLKITVAVNGAVG